MGADTPEKKLRAALLGLTQSVVGLAVRAGEPPDDGRARRAGQASMFDAAPRRLTRLVVAFDQGRPVRRRGIYPPYQTGREGDPSFMENEQYVLSAIGQFIELSADLPLTVLRGTNTEADDLISAAVHQAPEDEVRIASTDKDFLQLVDERVSIYATVKRLVIHTGNFVAAACPRDSSDTPVEFPRGRYLDYRAASGDASDNLPGIPGVGTLSAARLLASAPLDAYLDDASLAASVLGRRNARIETAITSGEARAAVERNRQLMDLRLAARNYPDLAPYSREGRWDEQDFRARVKEERISGLDLETSVAALAAIAEAR
jgi:5'-3' exonuclease